MSTDRPNMAAQHARLTRFDLWLTLQEAGVGIAGRTHPEPWPIPLIAAVFEVSERTVQRGLAQARIVRGAIDARLGDRHPERTLEWPQARKAAP